MSRLIKSTWVPQEFTNENKIISIRSVRPAQAVNDNMPVFESHEERERIIQAAQEEANHIIQQAHFQAQTLQNQMNEERARFEQQLTMLSEEARQAGYANGYQEGAKQGYTEATEFIEESKRTVLLSKQDYLKKLQDAEATILNIALKVADKIIGEALTGEPEVFLPVVKKALKEARDYKEIQLHVHPTYYEFLLAQKDDLVRIFPKETELYIYPDEDLSEQSCIIESANGRIDASVDQQLNEIKIKLYELLESE